MVIIDSLPVSFDEKVLQKVRRLSQKPDGHCRLPASGIRGEAAAEVGEPDPNIQWVFTGSVLCVPLKHGL